MTNGAHVAKPENVKSANSTKMCFSGFASPGSSLTEHHSASPSSQLTSVAFSVSWFVSLGPRSRRCQSPPGPGHAPPAAWLSAAAARESAGGHKKASCGYNGV